MPQLTAVDVAPSFYVDSELCAGSPRLIATMIPIKVPRPISAPRALRFRGPPRCADALEAAVPAGIALLLRPYETTGRDPAALATGTDPAAAEPRGTDSA